jgi:hypothetical protein
VGQACDPQSLSAEARCLDFHRILKEKGLQTYLLEDLKSQFVGVIEAAVGTDLGLVELAEGEDETAA